MACASVGMTALLDETMIAVALPLIASDLNTGDQISAVATAYFMSVLTFYHTQKKSETGSQY
jgi:MFS family permease